MNRLGPHLTNLLRIQYTYNMNEDTFSESPKVDWDHIHDIWFIAGFGTTHMDEASLHGGGVPNWSIENMDAVFLNKAKTQAEHSFPIKWDEFHKRYGGLVFRLGRNELLKAVLAFSKDEHSIKATYHFYKDMRERLGVHLTDFGDDYSSILPDFYYEPDMTAEDFFFDQFLSTKLPYRISDPVKFAGWVLNDHRWRGLVTLYSL